MPLHLVSKYLVHVNGASPIEVPSKYGELLHPELEDSGLKTFDIRRLNMSLGIREGQVILSEHREALEELFGFSRLYLWNSARENSKGVWVPYISARYSGLRWRKFREDWGQKCPETFAVIRPYLTL